MMLCREHFWLAKNVWAVLRFIFLPFTDFVTIYTCLTCSYVIFFLAPCVPQDVSALMECGSDSISLTWDPSLGAFLYFAMVVDQFGTAHTCTSSDPKCKFSGLHCGSIYNASVIASNAICNSSVSESISVETGTTHMKKYKNAITSMSDTS